MAWFNFSWKHWQIVLEAEVFLAGNMLSPSLIMIHRHTTYTQFQQLSKNNCLSVHIHIIIAFYCLYIAHCYSIRSFLAFRVWSKPRDHTRSVSNVRIFIACENAHYPHLCKFAENFSDAWWLRRQNFSPNSHNLACWQARIATVRRNSKKLKRRKLTRYSDSQDKSIVNVLYKPQRNTRRAFARKHDIFTHLKVTVAMATWSAAWWIAPFVAKTKEIYFDVNWFGI